MVIFMIFAPPHYLNRVKGYSQLLPCEAPNCGLAVALPSKIAYADILRCLLFFYMSWSKVAPLLGKLSGKRFRINRKPNAAHPHPLATTPVGHRCPSLSSLSSVNVKRRQTKLHCSYWISIGM